MPRSSSWIAGHVQQNVPYADDRTNYYTVNGNNIVCTWTSLPGYAKARNV